MAKQVATSLSLFEPVEDSEEEPSITCMDLEILPSGSLGCSSKRIHSNLHPPHVTSAPGCTPSSNRLGDVLGETEPYFHGMMPTEPTESNHVEEFPGENKKQKRKYMPIPLWLPHRETFLREMLRLEGRGDSVQRCVICGISDPNFRCTICAGGSLMCRNCLVSTHLHNPLHSVEVWKKELYFERVSLKSLGLVIQLGHSIGQQCPNPRPPWSKNGFVVIDVFGVQEVALYFCDCENSPPPFVQLLRFGWYPASVDRPQTAATNAVLKFFHILSFESKISMHEFYHTLARLTDNTGLNPGKDRSQAFAVMVRETRNLKSLKRGARGHEESGISGTCEGELAPLCPACPQPSKNMVKGWENYPPHLRFTNRLFLGLDGNFKLKRRDVSDEVQDPSLSDGMLFYVKQQNYQSHLQKFDTRFPPEKSSCSNHKAVDAERQCTPGYLVTGVSAVDCARHDMKRPLAVGDLHKGERYVSTDYVFFSSIQKAKQLEVVVSYDVGCQWSKKLWNRMGEYPEELTIPEGNKENFLFLVPKFHLPSHQLRCQTRYSFNYAYGVGRTDGEAPERGWAHMNAIASSTSEMGPGSRIDTLNDHYADNNWVKTTAMGKTLARKLKEAAQEARDHMIMYNDWASGVPKEKRERWLKELRGWSSDRSKPNPFERRYAHLTEHRIRKRLEAEEEEIWKNQPKDILRPILSAVDLISMGLNYEDQQRQLGIQWSRTDVTPSRRAELENDMAILMEHMEVWFETQHAYMSYARNLRRKAQYAQAKGVKGSEPIAMLTKLYLPSAILAISPNTEALDN